MSPTRVDKLLREKAITAVCLVLSGIGVGWLIGLSMSPVLHIVVASVLTAVVAVVSALAGIEPADTEPNTEQASVETTPAASVLVTRRRRLDHRSVTPVPLAIFIIGIVVGASVGAYGRSHDWLGADPQSLLPKWRLTKLSDEQIAQRLFDQLYPPITSSTSIEKKDVKPDGKSEDKKETEPGKPSAPNQRLAGGLLSGVPSHEYNQLRSAPDKDLRGLMLGSTNEHIRKFAQRCDSVPCLRAAVEELVWPDEP